MIMQGCSFVTVYLMLMLQSDASESRLFLTVHRHPQVASIILWYRRITRTSLLSSNSWDDDYPSRVRRSFSDF